MQLQCQDGGGTHSDAVWVLCACSRHVIRQPHLNLPHSNFSLQFFFPSFSLSTLQQKSFPILFPPKYLSPLVPSTFDQITSSNKLPGCLQTRRLLTGHGVMTKINQWKQMAGMRHEAAMFGSQAVWGWTILSLPTTWHKGWQSAPVSHERGPSWRLCAESTLFPPLSRPISISHMEIIGQHDSLAVDMATDRPRGRPDRKSAGCCVEWSG